MKTIEHVLVSLVGASLWIPAIAVINIGTWGLQVATILCIFLAVSIVIRPRASSFTFSNKIALSELYIIHGMFVVGLLISTLFSAIGIDRSILTLVSECIGVLISFTLSWWFLSEKSYHTSFLKGFLNVGFVFSFYSIYQSIALKQYLPFSYIGTNNASFALVGIEYAEFHGRSLGATPEPSVFASLILIMIGTTIVDVVVIGGLKSYFKLITVFIGFLSTGSQSVSIIPIYILCIYIFFRIFVRSSHRRFSLTDFLGLFFIIIVTITILSTNQSIVNNLARVISSDFSTDNRSATSRSADMMICLILFSQYPLFGAGLGGITELANKILLESDLDSNGASTGAGFTRMIAEQGLVGITFLLLSCKILMPTTVRQINKPDDIVFLGYNLCIIFSCCISLLLFVGYRNVYHLWLMIPVSLMVKAHFMQGKNINQS